MASDAAQHRSEFARGWPVVLAASGGVGLGVAGLLTYNSGLFARPLAEAFGLSRTLYGAAFFGSTLALALAMPVTGRLVDRYGPRAAATAGSLILAAGFVALATLVRSPATYILLMIGVGLLAGTSSPVPYTRAVAGSFDHSRGLALGLTQVGIGVSAALVPPSVSIVIAGYGWQAGFWTLAALALVGIIPALGLPRRGDGRIDAAANVDFGAVRRTPLFRLQLAAFATMALAFAGMLAHFVPMLREAGMSGERAGALAGLIGVSVIVTRVVVGWLADRIEAAWLGAASCAVCAAGCLVLAAGGTALAPVGALALGAAMGAEADLVGILTARHFGKAAYSRAYALQYAAFMVAAGLSPMWVGYMADASGGYRTALFLSALLLVVPTLLFLRLPAVRRKADLQSRSA